MVVIGRYEILGTLGSGSMGTVSRARDTVLGREIALKTIKTESAVDPGLRERFYQEARACAGLQHGNIVTVFDLGESDALMYIAMELLQGEDLQRLIERRHPYPLETKLTLMIEILAALDHAHRHGVIHRDIKPSNIFILREGHAKVLDFGIARLPSSVLTSRGKVLGTPNYMAPEQLVAKSCDARSDLFSAAIVFFEFVTGVHPFRGVFIPSRITGGSPEPLRQINPRLPASLERVLAHALEKQPDVRYQSAESFARDLDRVLTEVRLAPPDASEPDDPPTVEEPVRNPLNDATDPLAAQAPEPNLEVTQILTGQNGPIVWPPPPPPPLPPPRVLPLPPPMPPQPPVKSAPAKGMGTIWKIVGVFAALALLAGAATFFVLGSRQADVLSSVGTANVLAAEAHVSSEPGTGGKNLWTLKKGDRVNIVQAPGSERPSWLQVQQVTGGKVSPAGYVRASDLGNWSTPALWMAFRPPDTAPPSDRRAYIAALEQMLTESPDSQDAKRAQLWIAEQCVLLARAARESGQPAGEWLDRAESALRSLRGDRGLASVADELRHTIKVLRDLTAQPAPHEAEPQQPQQPPPDHQTAETKPYDPEPDYAQAEADWAAGRYASAERRLKRILRLDPGNQKAAALLDKVQKAQAIDPGIC